VQDGDLDVLVVWFGIETDQSEDAPYKEEGEQMPIVATQSRDPVLAPFTPLRSR